MKLLGTFNVTPKLPEALTPLYTMAYNFHWCWSHELIMLFRRLDYDLWEDSGHNPVRLLGSIEQSKLDEAASDDGFMSHLRGMTEAFDEYIHGKTWFNKTYPERTQGAIAYFSAEFGITESLTVYSGGLGILAGDHLKSASDLGIPLVAVGLMYQEGYFRQYLNADGWQQENYPRNDFYILPLTPERGADSRWLKVELNFPGRKVYARIIRADVGRIKLYLLDANLPENLESDRNITNQLYGGDKETRIQQEILLGIGGIRALHLLGYNPLVCHMNEGHSGFLALERIRMLMESQELTFEEAREAVRAGSVFTTHTPVPAGIDEFPVDLMEKYFREYYPQLGLTQKQFLALGQHNSPSDNAPFNMAHLSMRLASNINGVSQLHGEVSRKMWQGFWPNFPLEEVPITSITNGIHHRSWVSHDMKTLFDRYLSPRWRTNPGDMSVWEGIDDIPGEELWRTHERRRERLVAYARRKLVAQYKRRGMHQTDLDVASEVLDPSMLTIGFARRFATYKRATLLLKDLERLKNIMNNPERPVQFIFAGKAHPRDDEGKRLIRELVHTMRLEEFRRRMVFLEDYDIEVARYLVQGVDVWLNNPRRPMEASGTSGMKVLPNGGLNLSIPDGWWAEIDTPDAGWTIGSGEDYGDNYNYQDEVESHALYDILEREVAPLFYLRGRDGLPRKWIEKMRLSMKNLSAVFNTNRMVRDYLEKFYLPAMDKYQALSEDKFARARALASWKTKVTLSWNKIKVVKFNLSAAGEIKVGDQVTINAEVDLASLNPQDVSVQLYFGPLNDARQIENGKTFDLQAVSSKKNIHQFQGSVICQSSGRKGYGLRILPKHPDITYPQEMGLVYWYE